jgi:hypothetical protein
MVMKGLPPLVKFTDGVGGPLDAREEGRERLRPLIGPAGLGVAGVKIEDRGACLGGFERRVDDLVRRDGQVGRHGGSVNRPGNGVGDDDLAVVRAKSVAS